MRNAAMNLFGGKTFAHGVHPPESKDETSGLAIHQFPFAPLLIVPLSQHIGKAAVPIVGEGDEVSRGQRIADPDGFMSVPIHAPASGIIRRIAPSPSSEVLLTLDIDNAKPLTLLCRYKRVIATFMVPK